MRTNSNHLSVLFCSGNQTLDAKRSRAVISRKGLVYIYFHFEIHSRSNIRTGDTMVRIPEKIIMY